MISKWLFLLCALLLFSCSQSQERKVQQHTEETKKNEMNLSDFDSITINYWNSSDAIEYLIKYSKSSVEVTNNTTEIKVEKGEEYVNELGSLIDKLYIKQSHPVEIMREKLNDPVITDYSTITVSGYVGDTEKFKVRNSIGEEGYKVQFSPSFIRLTKLLDELITDE